MLLAEAFHAALQGSVPPSLRQQAASRFILASITDTDGRPVVDVGPDDFVIREDGQLRDVLTVRLADYPIAIVIDNDRWADRDSEAIRRATRRFIERIGHRPIAVASTVPPRLVATFSEDRERVLERVDKLRKGRSTDGLLQALATAARLVQENGAPFSAIVVVTANLGGAVARESLNPVIESGATVHVVLQQRIAGGASHTQQQTGEALISLVDETHGQLTTIYSADSYQVALDRQANQLATELMVEYVVPDASIKGVRPQLGIRLSGMKASFWGVSR